VIDVPEEYHGMVYVCLSSFFVPLASDVKGLSAMAIWVRLECLARIALGIKSAVWHSRRSMDLDELSIRLICPVEAGNTKWPMMMIVSRRIIIASIMALSKYRTSP